MLPTPYCALRAGAIPSGLKLLIACLCVSAFVTAQAASLRLGNAGEPQTLDPQRYNLRLEETILNDLFLGLVTFDAAGKLTPGVASSWSVSEDGLRWTFELDPRHRWSDGEPLTADDFVFAYRRLQDPTTAASLAYFMYPLKNAAAVNAGSLPPSELGVSAPAPHTLVLELEAPYPFLLERLLYPTAYPLPRHALEAHGDNWVKPEHWVSNGAYTLTEWRPQAHVRLTANTKFIEPPTISDVYYLPLASEQSAYNRYRAGEVDAIAGFPARELPTVERELSEHLRLSPQLGIIYLVFNTRLPPFDDVRVREALTLAVDQQTITDKVQRAGNVPSLSFVPTLVSDYEPAAMAHGAMSRSARLERGKKLLEEAGYDAGSPLTITLRYFAGAEAKRTALAIAAFWKPLGVRTELHHSELKVHFADLRQGEFELAQAGWIGESNAEHYLGLLVSDTGDVNYGGFADSAFDAHMAAARQEADVETRNAHLLEAERRANTLFPVVPLYSNSVRRLVNPEIEGWVENLRDAHPARFLRFAGDPSGHP